MTTHSQNKSAGSSTFLKLCLVTSMASFALTGCSTATLEPSLADASDPTDDAATITRAEIESAQQSWCDGLISISAASDPVSQAKAVVDGAYDFGRGPVLFKPTLTHGEKTFRFDREGALAYFVGENPSYPEDKGFALRGWTQCEFAIGATFVEGDVAMAMGNVMLTDKTGAKVKVDKTFGYARRDGKLRIVLHHSSLPYQPKTEA